MTQTTQQGSMWLTAIYGSAAAVAVGLVILAVGREQTTLGLIGGLGLFLVATTAPVAVYARKLTRGGAAATPRTPSDPAIASLTQAVRSMTEQQALSPDARRVLNRRRERDLLTQAIEEDIAARDFDAAMVLVKELAERFGYRADAENFRRRIDRERTAGRDQEVQEAIRQIDALIIRAQWHDAADQADRVARLYPDSTRVEGLRHRVADARDRYKAELERRFLHAAEAERIEEAMDLLKELDHYLTEQEAEPYTEVARGVIGKARENLGAQFKLAVQDRSWHRATEIGERIIREFPNSRMAAEVRQMIDGIRERAQTLTPR